MCRPNLNVVLALCVPWMSLALQVEPIIRSGIQRFTDQVGKLWILLADYYIRMGQFESVRGSARRWL